MPHGSRMVLDRPIQCRKNRALRPREFREMSVGNLSCHFDPSGTMVEIAQKDLLPVGETLGNGWVFSNEDVELGDRMRRAL
jgi:hypothetical protein